MLQGPASATAARLYIRDLERAYTKGREVYDPDYALAMDPDVYEVIRRDPDTQHAIQQRKHLVAGSRTRVVPADDQEPNRKAATVVEKLLGQLTQVGNFTQSRFHLADAIFRGESWALITGKKVRMRIGAGPAREWWVPTRLQHVDKRRFRQFVAQDGSCGWEMYSLRSQKYEPLADKRAWFVRVSYDDTEDALGRGRGLIEALYHAQYAKAKVWADGLAGLERWSMGIIKAKIDQLRVGATDASNLALVSAWLEQLDQMRARHALVHGEGDELEAVETSGTGHTMVMEFLGALTTSIRTLVLGANLPTSATSGGSYALAEVQENSTETLVNFDRELVAEAITRDLIGLVWRLNAQSLREEGLEEAEPPSFRIVSRISRDGNAATAISTLLNAGLRNFREDEIFEAVGLTPAGPFDQKIQVSAPAGAGVAEAPAPDPAASGQESQDPKPDPETQDREEFRAARSALYAMASRPAPAPPTVYVSPPDVTVNMSAPQVPSVTVEGATFQIAAPAAPNVTMEAPQAPAPIVIPAPIVNVTHQAPPAPPPLVIPAPNVTVEAAAPLPAVVVPAPQVTVNNPPPAPPSPRTSTVERDQFGKVVTVRTE